MSFKIIDDMINMIDVRLLVKSVQLLIRDCDGGSNVCYLNKDQCDRECQKLLERFTDRVDD